MGIRGKGSVWSYTVCAWKIATRNAYDPGNPGKGKVIKKLLGRGAGGERTEFGFPFLATKGEK